MAGNYALLDEPMILLNHIVDVERPPTSAIPAQFAGVFQLFDRGRVRRMAIHVDTARLNPPGLRDGKLEKRLRRKVSRYGESRKSMVLPAESMARYRYVHDRQRGCRFRQRATSGSDAVFRIGSAGSGPERI